MSDEKKDINQEHRCCGGHHHEEGHECCGGHHHEEGHECKCGNHHDHEHGEEHDCCGGHHHEEGHECGCGHHHEPIKVHGVGEDGRLHIDENTDMTEYLHLIFEALGTSDEKTDTRRLLMGIETALDHIPVKEENVRKMISNWGIFLLYAISATELDIMQFAQMGREMPCFCITESLNSLLIFKMQNNIDDDMNIRFNWHDALYKLYFLAYDSTRDPEVGELLLIQHFSIAEMLFMSTMWKEAKQALLNALVLGSEIEATGKMTCETHMIIAMAHYYIAAADANSDKDKALEKEHAQKAIDHLDKAGKLGDPKMASIVEFANRIIASN